jgi:hypothetical protein
MFSSFGRTVQNIIGNGREVIRSEVQLAKAEIMEELRGNIIGNGQEIIRSEVQLAKAEIMEELHGAAKAAAVYAAAGICAMFGLGFILWAGVYGLLYLVPLWLAVLIVGLAISVIGGIVLYIARKEVGRLSLRAKQTIATAKETVRWPKNRSS